MERADTPRWDKVDGFALAASIGAHALLFGLFWLSLRNQDVILPQPKPMAVEILAESDLEATSPDPSSEAPAAMKAMEEGPVEDAPAPAAAEPLPAPEPVTLPDPEPAPPLPVVKPLPQPAPKPVQKVTPKPIERPIPKPTVSKPLPKIVPQPVAPKATVKPQPKAVIRPAATPARRPAATPTATKSAVATKTVTPSNASKVAPTKSGAGSNKGAAPRPTGDLAGIMNALGKKPSLSKSTTPPAAKTAAQVQQSINTSIGNQVKGPWSQCRVTGIDVDELLTSVKFRLNRNGSLAGFESAATSGVNDSNRNQVARHQECAKKAVQQASPFTGLPPEHYAYWQNYEFKFQKR